MSGSTSPLRARIVGLLDGSAGVSPWVIDAGMFHAVDVEIEAAERTAVERAFSVHLAQRVPMEPVNTLTRYALYSRKLRVRVGYVLTEAGSEGVYEAAGEQSGASTREAVEDRADADAVLIGAVVGSLRNWAGLSGVSIIDVAPADPDGESPEMLGDRAIATHVFTVKSRDALPGSYGPTL